MMKVEKIVTLKIGNHCPNCKAKLDASQGAQSQFDIPSPGDVTVCAYCQCILVYDAELNTVNPTAEQIEEFKSEPELWQQLQKCRYFLKETF